MQLAEKLDWKGLNAVVGTTGFTGQSLFIYFCILWIHKRKTRWI